MKQDQRESRIAPFEEVAATLRRRLLGARRDAVESTFKSNVLARADIQLDATALYREDVYTDRRAGTIRVMTPVPDS